MELLIAASILNEINLRKAEVIRGKNMATEAKDPAIFHTKNEFDRFEWKICGSLGRLAVAIARTFRLHNIQPHLNFSFSLNT